VSCHWLTFSAAGSPAAAAADRRPPAGRWSIPRGAAGLRLQGTALTQLLTASSSSSSSSGGGGSQPSQWLEEHSTES